MRIKLIRIAFLYNLLERVNFSPNIPSVKRHITRVCGLRRTAFSHRVPARQTARHKSLCLLRWRQGNYYGVNALKYYTNST